MNKLGLVCAALVALTFGNIGPASAQENRPVRIS